MPPKRKKTYARRPTKAARYGEQVLDFNQPPPPPPVVLDVTSTSSSEEDEESEQEELSSDVSLITQPPSSSEGEEEEEVLVPQTATEQFNVLPPSPAAEPLPEDSEEEEEGEYNLTQPWTWVDAELAWFRGLREELMRAPALHFDAAFDRRIWEGWVCPPLRIRISRDTEGENHEHIEYIEIRMRPRYAFDQPGVMNASAAARTDFYLPTRLLLEEIRIGWRGFDMPVQADNPNEWYAERYHPQVWWPMYANDPGEQERVDEIVRDVQEAAESQQLEFWQLGNGAREALRWLEYLEMVRDDVHHIRFDMSRHVRAFILALVQHMWRLSFVQLPRPQNRLHVAVQLDVNPTDRRRCCFVYNLPDMGRPRGTHQRYVVNPWRDCTPPEMHYDIESLPALVAHERNDLLLILGENAAFNRETMTTLMWVDWHTVDFIDPARDTLWRTAIREWAPSFEENVEAANVQYGGVSREREWIDHGIDLHEEDSEELEELPGYTP